MNSRLMVRNRILERAQERFFAYGFMNVSMDEIASVLGMSKKTIYNHFSSKNKLIEATIEDHIISAISRYKQIVNSPLNYIDKLYKIFCLIGTTFMKMSKPYRDDLSEQRPDIWKRLEDIRSRTVFASFKTFIQEGVKNGIVRSEIQPEVLLIAYISALQGVDNTPLLFNNKITTDSAVESITRIYLDGILTEKAWQ
jgi:AcrR family transcriptional regulator